MLKHDLQLYFDTVFPHSKIEDELTIGGQVHIRFELGGEFEKGTTNRIDQATNRALAIFTDTFKNPDSEIWVLIYEYIEPNLSNSSNKYLHKQFPIEQFTRFYSQFQKEVQIIIGKLPVKCINIKNIIGGIANAEMGFDPSVDQKIFFLDQLSDRMFQMYDDRGCYVWSNKADKIRDIYLKRNSWIVDYHRSEIDKYFEQIVQ